LLIGGGWELFDEIHLPAFFMSTTTATTAIGTIATGTIANTTTDREVNMS
jgi:hypothetical protein